MFVLALMTLVGLAAAGTDQTLVDKATGSMVADAVVDKIQTACIFPNDRVLLRRMALAESKDGLDPNKDNSRGGIWQVSETRFQQTKGKSSLSGLYTKIQEQFGIRWQDVKWADLTKPLYSGLAARLFIALNTNNIPWSVADQAALWRDYYHSGSSTTTADMFTNAISALEKALCNVPKADITFVLDSSGSIGSANYQTMKDFVVEVVDSFNIDQDKVRVGLVTFSTTAKVEFALDKYDNKADVKNAVSSLGYTAGNTYTYRGLDAMRSMMTATKRASSAGVARFAVVLTDGQSADETMTAEAAKKVHDAGIRTFSVGVTSNINQAELEAIGSQPSCLHVFNLATFSDVTHFKKEIARRSCRVPALVRIGEFFSGELIKGQSQYLTLNVEAAGLTFKLSLTSGSVDLYLSYSIPNPSSALYDEVIQVDSSMARGKHLFVPCKKCNPTVKSQKVYAALVGTGVGQANKFKLDTFQGDHSGAAGLASMTALSLLSILLLLL